MDSSVIGLSVEEYIQKRGEKVEREGLIVGV